MQTPALSPTRFSLSKFARRTSLMAVVSAAALLTGGRALAVDSNLLMFAEHAPMPRIVARGTEMAAAEEAVARQHGCFAVQGEGISMEPVYLAGTALVVHVGGYEQLSAGTPVVYKNSRGVTVAHMLVEKKDGGWVAVGLNNRRNDDELVTEDNFVGVITEAFASKTGSLPRSVAARLALNEQLRGGAKVASAGM